MLQELTNSQLTATNATTKKVIELFQLSPDYMKMKWNKWSLQSKPYEMPERLSTTHIQFATFVHKLTYYSFLILREQP